MIYLTWAFLVQKWILKLFFLARVFGVQMYFDHFSCWLKAEGRAEEWGHFTKISQHDLSIGAQDESWRRPELVWWVKSSSG